MGESAIRIKTGITINIDASRKNITHVKSYIWNPSTCSCGNGKYLASIVENLMITCGEIIDSKKRKQLQKILKTLKYNL